MDLTCQEIWKPIPGFGPFEASCFGRIRNSVTGHLRKSRLDRGQYLKIRLGNKTAYVHYFIALAWLGPRPAKHVVNHRNGVKTDNTPGNLEYVTSRENNLHAIRTGLRKNCLTNEQIAYIRDIYKPRPTMDQLAARFGVERSTIFRVVHHKHVVPV